MGVTTGKKARKKGGGTRASLKRAYGKKSTYAKKKKRG